MPTAFRVDGRRRGRSGTAICVMWVLQDPQGNIV